MEGCSSHVNFCLHFVCYFFLFLSFFWYLLRVEQIESGLLLVLSECDKSWLPIQFLRLSMRWASKRWTLFSIRNGPMWTINIETWPGKRSASGLCVSFFFCVDVRLLVVVHFVQSCDEILNKVLRLHLIKRVSIWHCSWKIDVHNDYRLVLNHSSQVSDMQTAFFPRKEKIPIDPVINCDSWHALCRK